MEQDRSPFHGLFDFEYGVDCDDCECGEAISLEIKKKAGFLRPLYFDLCSNQILGLLNHKNHLFHIHQITFKVLAYQ